MRRLVGLIAGVMLAGCFFVPGEAANLRMRGGTVTPEPPTTETCPLGLAYTAFDGCLEANPDAQFQDANLIATYALDSTGSPQTIHHTGPYNKAGINFPVGQTDTGNKVDPRTISVVGQASTQTTSITYSTITNGGTPQVGMTVWDRPSNGTAWYNPTTAPKISGSCTGSLPALVCPLDRTVTARGNAYLFASKAPGCVTLIQGGGTNGTSNASYDRIRCDFRGSAVGMKAALANPTFAAVGGHNATILDTNGNSSSSGEVEITNAYITPDANTAGNNILSSNISHANIKLTLKDSECDGGNSASPILGPYVYSGWFGCFSWDSPGTSSAIRNQVLIKGVYAHDWAANPFSTQAGYTDTVFQNIFTNRISMNCGDTPPQNNCHGTIIAHGTTITGSSGSIKVQNVTAVYPYGQRSGVITGAISIQGGVNSAHTMEAEFHGLTIVTNTGATPGHAILEFPARIGRVGAVSSLKMSHMYVNSHGTYKCFGTGGDLQSTMGGPVGVMVANTGQRSSTITWSNLTGQSPIPFPGQSIVAGSPSSAVRFTASMANNGNGTSTLTITAGTPGFTLGAGTQLVALRLADIQTNPTLIVSGSGSTYIVSNGTGSGETRAAQDFALAQVLKPFGTIDPATGLPATAVGGSTTAGYNGSWVIGGERTYTAPSPGSPANQNWAAFAPKVGNAATIDTDVHDLWMMNIAGDAGKIIFDGADLEGGSCPGTQAP